MANRYWVGGTGNWSDDDNHWASSSGGGAANGNLPTSSDDVFIDSNSGFGSGGTITMDGVSAQCNNFTSNSGHTYTIVYDTCDIEIYGSAVFEAGTTFDSVSEAWTQFYNSGSVTLTANGATIWHLQMEGSGTVTLQDTLVLDETFEMKDGTFDANDQNITANDFQFYGSTGTPIFNMGSGTHTATGTGDVWYMNIGYSNVTINAETSTIKITNATATAKNFNGKGKTYYNLWLTGAGTGSFNIVDSNTFNDFKVDTPPHTIIFEQGSITYLNSFTVSGTAGNLMTFDSSDSTNQFTLDKETAGIVECDYLDLSNSYAINDSIWYAGSHSNDTTNNDGWIFEDAPTTSIKKVSGVIYASIKKISGVVIASVKKVSGVA